MKIKEVMNKNIPIIKADDSLEKAIKLLVSIPQSALPVLDKKGRVAGELSQRELLILDVGKEEFEEAEGLGFEQLKLLLERKAKTVKELMNKHELTLSPDDDLLAAAKLLYDNGLATIPIVDNKGKLVGIITDICILKHYKEIQRKKGK